MKIHVFDLCLAGRRFRGFTRDRAAIRLKVPMKIGDVRVSPFAWKYRKTVRLRKGEMLAADEILQSVGLNGFSIREMPKLPTKFYVFDMELDIATIKIFSEDRNLTLFRRRLDQTRLGTQADRYQGEKEKFLGEVEIQSKEDASRLGITDYDGLVERGLQVEVVRIATHNEFLGKHLTRHLNEESKKRGWGIIIKDVTVDLRTVEAREVRQPTSRDDGRTHSSSPNADMKSETGAEATVREPRGRTESRHADENERRLQAGIPMLRATLNTVRILGLALIIAGIVLVWLGSTGTTEFNLFGNSFKSQNVGVVGIFCGTLMSVIGIRRILTTVERLGQRDRQ
jgi:hypothetical protein